MKYTVTGPDGKKWTVNAPEGASEQDAISYIAHAHYSKKSEPTKYDPTEGMSTFDKVAAGAGKAVYDAGRGIGNLFGMVSDEDVQQAHDRDKALMDTGAGVAGNVAGNLAMMVTPGVGLNAVGLAAKAPKLIKAGQALMVPKTVLGAGAQGAAWGAIEPVTDDSTRVGNILKAGAGGAAVPGAVAAYGVGKSVLRPLTAGGRQTLAGRVIDRFATDPSKIANARTTGFVPGEVPTLAEAVDDTGLSQLQRTLLNNPDANAPITSRLRANTNARTGALRDMTGNDGLRDLLVADRATATKPLYDTAFAQGMNESPWIKGQITQLSQRDAFRRAMDEAARLASNEGVKLNPANATQVAHYTKMALDDMIDNAVGQQAGAHTIKGLAQTRDKLVSLIESQDFAPAYREARETYKAMSRPINQMEVADDLYKKLVPAMNDFGADTRVHANAYAEALRGGDRTAQKALGYSGAKLENIMEPAQMETLQGIAKGLGNSARAAEQGMGRGSPTAQNIVSQDLLSSVVGPLGLPQKWGDSMVNTGATLLGMRPEWAKPFERMTMEELGKAAADPVLAQEMLRRGMRRSPFDRLLDSSAPYAGMLGAPIGLTQ